jgi:hypothetical protein
MPRVHHWYRDRVVALAAVAVISLLHSAPTGASPVGRADRTEVVASVLLDFVHVATARQRAVLTQIVDDPAATPAQRTLAVALLHVFHTADRSDRSELWMLANDCSEPPLVRTVARVIHDLEHTPTNAQKRAIRSVLRSVA